MDIVHDGGRLSLSAIRDLVIWEDTLLIWYDLAIRTCFGADAGFSSPAMTTRNLMKELAERPVCGDGAMGTLLMARGMGSGDCGMTWNLDRPGDVTAIHRAYRNAGSQLITTNSFGGSRFVLAMHGHAGDVAKLNEAAAKAACEAAGDDAWVLGDVGPCGDFLEPVGELSEDEVREAFAEQIRALIAGGADAILVETMSDPVEMTVGIEAALQCDPQIPVIATYAFQKTAGGEFRTMMGTPVAEAIGRAVASGASIVGANCGASLDLEDYVTLCREIVAAAGEAHVIIQPNAGSPQQIGDKTLYLATPEQMADTATRLLDAGARIVGGCCGTTPAHLEAIAGAVAARG
jgi:5-methyltetrahydrofolate--homocysteine methyltransferase